MALLFAEAKKLANNHLVLGIATEIFKVNPIMQVIPWIPTSGKAYVFNRESTNPTAAAVAEDGTLTSGALAVTEVSETLKSYYVQNDISGFTGATRRDQDPRAILLAKMGKSLSYKIAADALIGDGTSNTFKGLGTLCSDASRDDLATSATDGQAISFSLIRTLIDAVYGCNAILAPRRTIVSIKALFDALGGTTPMMTLAGGYNTVAVDGIPVIPCDDIPTNVTQGATSNTTSIYAIRTNPSVGFEDEGVSFVYADKYPMGYKTVDLGPLEDKDNDRLRLMQYMSMVTHSTLAIGAAKGITN